MPSFTARTKAHVPSDGTTTTISYKTFVCNAGTNINMPGATAKKKRQRDDGSNYYKEFQRPEAMELYYAGCGKIDQHNRHRQYLLGLEKRWATQKWQTRIRYLYEILSTEVHSTVV